MSWEATIGAIGGIAGGALGMLGAKKQQKYSKELMGIQMKNQQELNRQGQELGMKTWQDTNYQAQMEEIRKAGLNPALLYGMGGAGGATASSASGGSASAGGGGASPQMGIAIQGAMMASQIELNKSQANKNNVEATKLGGVDTGKVVAETGSITQGIQNLKAVEELTKTQNKYQGILAEIAKGTAEYQIETAKLGVNKIVEEIRSIGLRNSLDSQTINDKVKIVRQEALGAVLKNTLTRADINLTNTQIQEINTKIVQKWTELGQGQQSIDIAKFRAQIEAEYPAMGKISGKVLNGIWDMVGSWDKDYVDTQTRQVRKEAKY